MILKKEIPLDTYCSLPFTGFDDRSKSICCWTRLKNKYETYSDLVTSQEVLSIQHNLTNGIQDPICRDCWRQESIGIQSMRQWSIRGKELHKLHEEISLPRLRHLVIDSGNVCNLACRSCGSWSSSAYFVEDEARAKRYNQYIFKQEFKKSNLEKILKEDFRDIRTVNILGGEPFLNLDHLKILEKIINDGHSTNCSVSYSTNATIKLSDKIIKLFKKFKEISLSVSIDAVGKQFNYIRTLGDWNNVINNVKHFKELQQTIPTLDIGAHPTISILNVLYLEELFDWFEQQDIKFNLIFCDEPVHYNFSILSDNKKQLVIDHLKKSKFDMSAIINCINISEFSPTNLDNFWDETKFTKEFRGLDLEEYLPRIYQLLL